ncbi:MAG: molecular chaperone GroEL [Parvibaculum sp.]|nr:molecular chaperone GroEL [Parvibaculum sp.]
MSSNQLGFTPKNLDFGSEGQKKLIRGITKMANAVKSTLGPSGNTVLIESPHHTHGITVTKDGVTVAKSIDLLDPVENLAVRMMREAADRTATSAGDGTTTSIVLTEALVTNGISMLNDNPDVSRVDVFRHMVSMTDDVVASLKKKSKKVTKQRLLDVATISANNDREIGKIIAGVHTEVGENGIVTVEKSMTSETYSEVTNGVKVDRGYTSPMFINNHKRDECIMEDVYILVSDAEISNILQIENVLKPIIQGGKKLLIVAPASTNVVNTLAANVMKSKLSMCNIAPPNFGYKQHELMQDIALSVGATYFSEKTGDDLSLINFSDLGHASKVIVGRDSTVILKDDDSNNAEIQERVAELWVQHDNNPHKQEKEFILTRIASLTGGIGVIYVGGNTDLEQKELFDRVDDAVCAVRSAMEEGILPGSGVALHDECERLLSDKAVDISGSKKIAYAILSCALLSPMTQIFNNAGLTHETVDTDKVGGSMGYNVKTGEFGDLYKMGVIDPVKVTRTALQNAVSVAVTMLSTDAIVTMARTYEAQ